MQSNNPSNLNRLAAGYTFLAPFYSWLTRLVYGKNFNKLNTLVAERIKENATILIIGGGDGKIIEALLAKKPKRITYIEMSIGMLREAQKEAARLAQNTALPPIDFVSEAFPTKTISAEFDTVITPFVCDTLEQSFLEQDFLPALIAALKPNGNWINLDFRAPLTHEKGYALHLKMIHSIFQLICGIQRKTLPQLNSMTSALGIKETSKQEVGWFEILVHRKTTH